MGLTGQALAVGAVVGLGLVLLAAALLPAGPPDLQAALARLDAPLALEPALPPGHNVPPGTGSPSADSRRAEQSRWLQRWVGWWLRLGRWVGDRTPPAGPLAAPAADLRLLGIAPAAFAAVRTSAVVAGLAAPAVLWTVAAAAGVRPPLPIPAVFGLGLAVAGWLLPAAVVAQRATAARAVLRVALSAYLDLVALERAGAGSPVEALEAAAAVGHGPAFALVRGRLALAARSGGSPYAALAVLGDEVRVPELRDLAAIAATAADGAAIYTTLLAKSRSLRNAIATDAHAAANAASERLVFPVVLLGTAFLLLVFYPALARLLATGS